MFRINLPVLFFLAFMLRLYGQENDFFTGYQRYSFIKYEENELIFPETDTLFNRFFARLGQLIESGEDRLSIVHMGGSHIQADIYTNVMRERFRQLSHDMNGSRGFIFPYKMARTNNPSNYTVSYTGTWSSCRSTRLQDVCELGLSGIVVSTTDSLASIMVNTFPGAGMPYYYSVIRVFHDPTAYKLTIESGNSTFNGNFDTLSGFTKFELPERCDSFRLRLVRQSVGDEFRLMGFSLDDDTPGIIYNAIGVNGARLSSYLRCALYREQLALLEPDLIIFSIGTNDGYTRMFNKEKYYFEYCELLDKTREAAPDAAILLTVPNDSYLYKRYVNQNTAQMREIIFKLANEYGCGVWDFYTIMGGLNSAQAWYSLKLMQYDRIHFTREGYTLKGNLLFTAFLKNLEGKWAHNDSQISYLK